MTERWAPKLADFRDVTSLLAEHMINEADVDRMAEFAQLDMKHITRGGTPLQMWEERFKAGIREGKLSPLLVAVADAADVSWAPNLAEAVREVAERALFGVVGQQCQVIRQHLDALHGAETTNDCLSEARRLRDVARAVMQVLDQPGLWQALPVFAADSSAEEVHSALARHCLRLIEAAQYLVALLRGEHANADDDVLPVEAGVSRAVGPEERDHLRATVRATAAVAREARNLTLTLAFRISPTKQRS